jgi:glutathione S-transferase
MLELYNAPVSTCSQRVRMALSEKGLDWIDHRVSLRDGEQVQPAYLAINPNGVVPTLVHDGKVVGDSSVILEYLEDVFPQNPLRPADPYALARMRMWRQYIDEVPTPATRVPSFHASFGNGLRKMTPEARGAAAALRPLRRHMLLKIGPDGFSARDLGEAMEQINQSFERMEQALQNGAWLCGDMFTIADISMLPTVVRMEDLGFQHLWQDKRRVASWYSAVQKRKSFADAYTKESRTF